MVDAAALIKQSLQALTFSPLVGNMPPHGKLEPEGFFRFRYWLPTTKKRALDLAATKKRVIRHRRKAPGQFRM